MKYRDRDWLHNELITKNKTQLQVSREISVHPNTIYSWAKRFDIQVNNSTNENHIIIIPELQKFIDGEMLGDGSILKGSKYSGLIGLTSKYIDYLQYMKNELEKLGIQISGKLYSRTYIHPQTNNEFTTNVYRSKSYRELTDIYSRWYLIDFCFCSHCGIIFHEETTNRKRWINKRKCPVCERHELKKKIVPKDIELTPVVIRHWYIGDGSLTRMNKKDKIICNIRLSTVGFLPSHVDILVDKLNDLGFNAKRDRDNTIRLPTYMTNKFINYIGECPEEIEEIYGYKWPNIEERIFIDIDYNRINIANYTYKNKQWLKEQYIDKNKSGLEISNMIGVTHPTIYHWLDEFELRD